MTPSVFHAAAHDPQGPIAAAERLILVNATVIMLAVIVPVILLTIAVSWWFRAGNKSWFGPFRCWSSCSLAASLGSIRMTSIRASRSPRPARQSTSKTDRRARYGLSGAQLGQLRAHGGRCAVGEFFVGRGRVRACRSSAGPLSRLSFPHERAGRQRDDVRQPHLGLEPPRGLHPHPAGLRCVFGGHLHRTAQARPTVPFYRLFLRWSGFTDCMSAPAFSGCW